ncbi:MAG: hypothetical protein K940chlam8_00791 [Chlamydiae bacterium]|nr:hypothetical protein [Chlamydiota bacterium]
MMGGGTGITFGTGGTGIFVGAPMVVAGAVMTADGFRRLAWPIIADSMQKFGNVLFSKTSKSFETSKPNKFKKAKSKISGKEGAKDAPSWAKGKRPYNNESGKDFAKRLLDEKNGKGNYDKGPGSDYNKIKKWGDRSFE